MHDSNRGKRSTASIALIVIATIVAMVVGITAIAYGISKQIEYNWDADQHNAEYARHTDYPARYACLNLPINDQSDCVAKAADASRNYDRAEQDLVAQKTSAIWAFLMGSAAIVGLILSTIGVFLVWTTFHATKEANIIAREVGRDQARAYVYASGFYFEPNSVSSQFILKVKNGGSTPAKTFSVRQFLSFNESGGKEIVTLPKDLVFDNWGALGAGDELTIATYNKNWQGPIPDASSAKPESTISVIGTIKYVTIYNEVFTTDFTFFLTLSRAVGAKKVKFSRHIVEGFNAFHLEKGKQ